jgi:hypothetical protein
MNTQLSIKTRQLLFSPSLVTLLIGIVAVLFLSGPSIQAQTTTTTATAAAAPVDSSLTITTKGSVSDPNGTVTVTGDVIITARMVKDTTSTTAIPIVLLDFDFSQLKGTTGSSKTTLRTYVTGDNHATAMRPLQSSDTIIVSAPYFDSSKDALSARTMLVTASLTFDVATGKLTGASLSVGNNVATSATVGTITATPQ